MPSNIPFTGVATLVDNASNVMGTATLTATGTAKFSVADLAPGTYNLTVSYAGDVNHTAAFSSPLVVQVNPAISMTVLTSCLYSCTGADVCARGTGEIQGSPGHGGDRYSEFLRGRDAYPKLDAGWKRDGHADLNRGRRGEA